jgi:hypothetical protein
MQEKNATQNAFQSSHTRFKDQLTGRSQLLAQRIGGQKTIF